jgi:hypothetical protein
MEPFVWNYILEKDLDVEDNSSIDDDKLSYPLCRHRHRSPATIVY